MVSSPLLLLNNAMRMTVYVTADIHYHRSPAICVGYVSILTAMAVHYHKVPRSDSETVDLSEHLFLRSLTYGDRRFLFQISR